MDLNPVYNILGYKMRLNWFEAHHLYWGILILTYGIWGSIAFFNMGMYTSSIWILLLSILLQILHMLISGIGIYVIIDDIYQHHQQVDTPEYHSPVHNWYRGILSQYPLIKLAGQKLDLIIGKLKR